MMLLVPAKLCFVVTDVAMMLLVPAKLCFVVTDVAMMLLVPAKLCFVVTDVAMMLLVPAKLCIVVTDVAILKRLKLAYEVNTESLLGAKDGNCDLFNLLVTKDFPVLII